MKKSRVVLLVVVLVLLTIPVSAATDYAVDPTFNPTFVFSDFNVDTSIGDVVVQPDGKILIGGTFSKVNGETIYYLARLNPDGTRDTTFNSAIIPSSGFINYVRHITPLADGKLLVTGKFKIGNEYSSYVKLNADGSIDASMPNYAPLNEKIVALADGKFLHCSGRWINEETYWMAHRMNADGSVDPSFRVTFAEGTCFDIQLQPDGKILMSGSFRTPNNFYFEPIQRLNADGSRDETFNLATSSAYGAKFSLLPDGKILVSYAEGSSPVQLKRFNSDGSVDLNYPNCASQAFLALSNGNVLINGCRKFAGGLLYQFGSVRPNGAIEPSLDWLDFNGNATGFRAAADGKYYVFGNFTTVGGVSRNKIVRLMPYAAPIKAKFDFDGDGRADPSVFRRSDRYWYLYRSTAGPAYINWGLSTDLLAAADYDFDGKTDVGIFRATDGNWLGFGSTSGYTYFAFGQNGDRPHTGDFDNDGKNDWALRRVSGGVVSWLVKRGGSPYWEPFSSMALGGEMETDKAVVGDFDGDHRDELGFFRDGTWSTRDYGSGAPVTSFQWGSPGDIPVPADYDGDGQCDYAVFRPSTGVWWINQSTNGVFIIAFGLNGDIPVPADYDGDGKVDVAIFRNGQWWQYRSNGGVYVDQWGIPGDLPIPAQAQ